MRLTNSTLLRGYNRDLSRLKNAKNECEKKITTTRRFSRASEAPLSAAKALNVRKSQYYSAQYKENLSVAAKFYTEAETSLLQVSDKMAEIRETIIAAVNTTKEQMDYNIYSQQLETRAQELCAILNTDSAERSIFGGDSDNGMPFNIINDSEGHPATVLYHNVPVNAMNDYKGFPYSDDVYMDIGIGMTTDQKAHTQDPMSVLNISFNGVKVTGCGADYGVADVDLSAIQENRSYAVDIYADGRKQTIAFRGKGTPEENVAQINKLLDEAYLKDHNLGLSTPKMDAQGMIRLCDASGKPLEKGVVAVVNNTSRTDSARTEKLVVDNDSNYTAKYRFQPENLDENKRYKIDVELDGEKKTIAFMSGADDLTDPDNPIYSEDVSIKNFQDAIDKEFGAGVITITTEVPNKGVLSAEGKTVKLLNPLPPSDAPDLKKATIGALDLTGMTDGASYDVKASVNGTEYNFNITAGATPTDTGNAIAAQLKTAGGFTNCTFDANSGVFVCDGEVVNFFRSTGADPAPTKSSTVPVISAANMQSGKVYEYNVTVGGDTKTISITGGADKTATLDNIKKALNDAFGADVVLTSDGAIVSAKGETVSAAANTDVTKQELFDHEKIYSNNYIQLTLDAARALRNGDIEYANACIDRIVEASEKLLVQIADLGCNEDFIDFNKERITIRELNLAERQDELESTDPEEQITLWKTYEAYYNACLQMSSSVIPNSIFNYMR